MTCCSATAERSLPRLRAPASRRPAGPLRVHHSTYYAWKRAVDRHGLEMLRPRERRAPRMPNQLSKTVEERIVAFALAHPGLGPKRVASELGRPKWGGILVSPNGVWRALCQSVHCD
jgi:transposase